MFNSDVDRLNRTCLEYVMANKHIGISSSIFAQQLLLEEHCKKYIVTHDGFKGTAEMNNSLGNFYSNIPQDWDYNTTIFSYLNNMSYKGFPIIKKHISSIIKPRSCNKSKYASIMAIVNLDSRHGLAILKETGFYDLSSTLIKHDDYKYLTLMVLFNFAENRFTHFIFGDSRISSENLLFHGY